MGQRNRICVLDLFHNLLVYTPWSKNVLNGGDSNREVSEHQLWTSLFHLFPPPSPHVDFIVQGSNPVSLTLTS